MKGTLRCAGISGDRWTKAQSMTAMNAVASRSHALILVALVTCSKFALMKTVPSMGFS